ISSRISPRPGSTIQNARASPAATLIQYRVTLQMIATNWRLPDAPLRASAVTAELVGLAALVCLAQIARSGLPLGASYALKASAAFAAVMAISIGFLQRHHPFERFGPANQITTARAMLVALIASLVGEPRLP